MPRKPRMYLAGVPCHVVQWTIGDRPRFPAVKIHRTDPVSPNPPAYMAVPISRVWPAYPAWWQSAPGNWHCLRHSCRSWPHEFHRSTLGQADSGRVRGRPLVGLFRYCPARNRGQTTVSVGSNFPKIVVCPLFSLSRLSCTVRFGGRATHQRRFRACIL